ncbi:MAG: amidohydrolase [Bacteroidia bacterium]
MSLLNVSLVQTHLFWEDEAKNLSHFDELINQITQTDIIILPEMFTTGFSMRPDLFASVNGNSVQQKMKKWAMQHNSAICGSAMMSDNLKYYNRFYWVEPSNKVLHYDKAHLFRMGKEHEHYTAGKKQVLINYKGFKIAPFICYDLRFPVWLKRTRKFNYDVMIIVANWPERRSQHWKVLLQARAIENQCFLFAVNRTGNDGNGVSHSGNSMIIKPTGEIVWHGTNPTEIVTKEIDLTEIWQYRQSFPVELDDDMFEIL